MTLKQSRTLRFDTEKADDIKALEILKALKDGTGNQFIINAIINYDKCAQSLKADDIRTIIREEIQALNRNIKIDNSILRTDDNESAVISANEGVQEVRNTKENKAFSKAMSFIDTL